MNSRKHGNVCGLAGAVPVAGRGLNTVRTVLFSAAALVAALGGATAAAQCLQWNDVSPPDGPGARAGHGLAYDAGSSEAILFSGNQGLYPLPLPTDTWSYDGRAWTSLPASGPSGRQFAAMTAGLTGRGADIVLLFGGNVYNYSWFGDTWQFTNQGWTQLLPAHSPSQRSTSGFAYDSDRQAWVLFGGYDGTSWFGDTWEFNGTDWTLKATTGPTGRAGPGMAYDAARHLTVLFGGRDASGSYGDTWTWDGTKWTAAATTGPAPRSPYGGMAYDPNRQLVVLFGGRDANGNGNSLGDTWAWGGTGWSQVPTGGPLPRFAHALIFDPPLATLVMYGGYDTDTHVFLTDTWQAVCRGDMNCDGVVNFADIDPFVLALSNPAAYQAAYPNCPLENGDCNGDGQVDFGDIDPFVAILSGG